MKTTQQASNGNNGNPLAWVLLGMCALYFLGHVLIKILGS